MTKLLDEAIAKVRELPQDEQEIAAAGIMKYLAAVRDPQLSDKQLAELRRRRANKNPIYLTLAELDARLH